MSKTHQRAQVAKLQREDLEDQHLRILDENDILKTHARKQEDKIKRMATKLVRMVNDRKKIMVQQSSGPRNGRDVELEEKIENQQDVIRQNNKENDMLKQKIKVLSQQLQSSTKRPTPYSHVQSRIRTGNVPKTPEKSAKFNDRTSHPPSSPQPQRYGHSLLEEARSENQNLQEQILVLQEQIGRMEEENERMQMEMNRLHNSREDEMLKFREQVNTAQRSTLGDNVELIKIQRQMKEKSTNLIALEGKFHDLHMNYEQIRGSYDQVLSELDRLKSHLRESENINLNLQQQLKHGNKNQRLVLELQSQKHDLENEVSILKESNEKLTDSAFDVEKEQQWIQLERRLRTQIAQLEVAIKADVEDKSHILERINNNQGYVSSLHSESRRTEEEKVRLRRENEELRSRIQLYAGADDSVDVVELREALSIVRQRQHNKQQRERPDFLEAVDDSKDSEMSMLELQGQHVETIQELEKTREMLLMQHRINKDYQMEVESASNKLEEMRREYEDKLDKFARLLDARAAKIKKLESQLHDVAYGTKQYKFHQEKDDYEDEINETVQLERGENLFEINVTKLTLSAETLEYLGERNPCVFVTFAFFDFELVSTPILKNSSPRFDFTSQYVVKVDDIFLHHLQKESTLFEVHQALGIEHKTIASCKVKFNKLLDKSQGKLHGTVTVIGLNGVNFGSLDFWARLRVPMDQAIRLYRERTKALGYLAPAPPSENTLEEAGAEENMNQLSVEIISCNQVEGRRKGSQPHIYCVYKLFDFADHDTNIIPNSNSPHFQDRQIYPVQMNSDLDSYLKSEKLQIYVFDDTDPDISSYLGKAWIDLIPLAHNKTIKAPFQLTLADGSENGTVEVSLAWQVTYVAPQGVMRGPRSIEDDNEITQAEKLVSKPPSTPKKKPKQSIISKLSRPSASSTPKPLKREEEAVTKPVKKKVSILEPNKDPPIPLTRSIRPLVIEETPTKDDETIPDEIVENFEDKQESSEEIEEEIEKSPEDGEDKISEEEVDEDLGGMEKESQKFPDLIEVTGRDDLDDLEEFIAHREDDGKLGREDDKKAEESDPDSLEDLLKSEEEEEEKEEQKPEEEEKETKDENEDNMLSNHEESDIEEEIEEIPDNVSEGDKFSAAEETEMGDEEGKGEVENQEEDLSAEEEVASMDDITEVKTIEKDTKSTTDDTIRISINHLTLDPDTSVWGDSNVEQMFIEFDFLGEVDETPSSLPKPKNKNQKLEFNFGKRLKIDSNTNLVKRNTLKNMLSHNQATLKMTVVSEPINDEDADCEEIGSASVDLEGILQKKRDIINDDVIIEDLRNPDEVLGKINIDIEALAALQAIKNELNERLKEKE